MATCPRGVPHLCPASLLSSDPRGHQRPLSPPRTCSSPPQTCPPPGFLRGTVYSSPQAVTLHSTWLILFSSTVIRQAPGFCLGNVLTTTPWPHHRCHLSPPWLARPFLASLPLPVSLTSLLSPCRLPVSRAPVIEPSQGQRLIGGPRLHLRKEGSEEPSISSINQ